MGSIFRHFSEESLQGVPLDCLSPLINCVLLFVFPVKLPGLQVFNIDFAETMNTIIQKRKSYSANLITLKLSPISQSVISTLQTYKIVPEFLLLTRHTLCKQCWQFVWNIGEEKRPRKPKNAHDCQNEKFLMINTD